MQEEIEKKTIALVVSSSEMTGRVLAQAMRIYLHSRNNKSYEIPKGKQSLADLEKQNAALSNIEITNKNIRSFDKVAKKYELDYALKKTEAKHRLCTMYFSKDGTRNAFQWRFPSILKNC